MYCQCGCGQVTNKISRTDRSINMIKGQHYCYIAGHQNWGRHHIGKGYDKLVILHSNKHLCQCGCGQTIKVQKFHFYGREIPKYILGHHANIPEMKKIYRENNSKRIGELNPRWKENRDDVRGRIRCKVDFTKRQKRNIFVRDNGICQICGIITCFDVSQYHPEKTNIDHIVAVKDGGVNMEVNGQVLCLSCHKFKHSAKAKTANSVKPNLEKSSMAIPNQKEMEIINEA